MMRSLMMMMVLEEIRRLFVSIKRVTMMRMRLYGIMIRGRVG